ncbi:sodium:calcium antiporter [Thiohalomonas denitrificans]|uniref:sodium:calcium antiporter n=1 Tax=Thiohalomonas denitrificans TaxID=415747 RepID=UPI0026EFEF8F|nr:sodium:calcium antiporter [Thiohalomonas denitrificans]
MDALSLARMPLTVIIALFVVATIVITIAGIRLTRIADALADLTGLGEAIFGAVLLGGSTSLSGIVTSVVAAYNGYPALAISNAVGGIAAQTTFLAIADFTYRRANLEHAAASIENLVQGALLITLLSIPVLAVAGPPVDFLGIHPLSLVLVAAYLAGTRLIAKARAAPLWRPMHTHETREDEPTTRSEEHVSMPLLWLAFFLLAAILAAAGYVVAYSGMAIADRTGLSEGIVGGLFTAVATSLPELVTALAAVRQGALTMAVGVVIGGNSFDVLFTAFADFSYREGSIYHAITGDQLFTIALTLLLTGILLLGLLRREQTGFANIGFESVLMLLVYVAGMLILGIVG